MDLLVPVFLLNGGNSLIYEHVHKKRSTLKMNTGPLIQGHMMVESKSRNEQLWNFIKFWQLWAKWCDEILKQNQKSIVFLMWSRIEFRCSNDGIRLAWNSNQMRKHSSHTFTFFLTSILWSHRIISFTKNQYHPLNLLNYGFFSLGGARGRRERDWSDLMIC